MYAEFSTYAFMFLGMLFCHSFAFRPYFVYGFGIADFKISTDFQPPLRLTYLRTVFALHFAFVQMFIAVTV